MSIKKVKNIKYYENNKIIYLNQKKKIYKQNKVNIDILLNNRDFDNNIFDLIETKIFKICYYKDLLKKNYYIFVGKVEKEVKDILEKIEKLKNDKKNNYKINNDKIKNIVLSTNEINILKKNYGNNYINILGINIIDNYDFKYNQYKKID